MNDIAQRRATQFGKNLHPGVPNSHDDRLNRLNEIGVEHNAFTELRAGVTNHTTTSVREHQVDQGPTDSQRYMQHRRGSVWAQYKQCFELELNGKVDIAVPRASTPKLVVIRRAATSDFNRQANELLQIMKQPYFAKCFEVFGSVSSPYFVCEYLSLTLGHLLAVPTFPTEVEVRAIAGQVCVATSTCHLV
jgi:hypothetical protein